MTSTRNCTDQGESSLNVEVRIRGKVGRKLTLDWKSSSASLNQFTGGVVKLAFRCFYSTTTPPLNSHYTQFSATSEATGSIPLRRTRHKG